MVYVYRYSFFLQVTSMSQKVTGPATVVPWLESPATCARRAAPSFRHGTAAQPRSETGSSAAQGPRDVARPERTGAPWNSPRDTRNFPWRGPHGTPKHLYIYIYISYIIHPDPSSSSSPALSSSVIHLHAIMLPSFINHHACIQIKNAKRHPSARLEHHAADETSNLPNAGHWNVAILQRKAAPHCPRTHFLRHNHHMGSHWDQIVSLIQKIILEGPWFLVISWCSILFNHYMTMCRILHMMCDKNDINWYHIGFGPPRYPRLEVVPLFLQLENRFLDKPTSFTCNPGRKCDAGPGFGTSFSALVHLI